MAPRALRREIGVAIRTVVVGGGSAGCVIASRLTEDPDQQVLLLEAGPDYLTALPADLRDGTRNSMRAHDWGLVHTPNSRQWVFPLPRGRVVGGSSAVNTCIALRGCPRDFDEWGARGLRDWSWDQCLPAFKRLERDLDHGARPWHGDSGPLPIRRHAPDELRPWSAAFLDAAERAGHPVVDDHNEPGSYGASPHPMNKIDGNRVSAAEAWLPPAVRARPNLTIQPETTAVRFRLDGDRAVGLDVLTHGQLTAIEADRFVLCCGAVHSPGVLLRSGIGTATDLDRIGVSQRLDLPVAQRLLDHPGAAFFCLARPSIWRSRAPLIQVGLKAGRPDGHPGDWVIQAGNFLVFPQIDVPVLVSLMASLGKPVGAGTLSYTSSDPSARPLIESKLLDHPDDRAQMVDALLAAHTLVEQEPMRRLARPALPFPWRLRDRALLDETIRGYTDSGYHPCGTTPMGVETDPIAVCDGRGRVHGVQNLFIGDAGLFPTIPSVNIHLPTLMVAERIAAWLLGRRAEHAGHPDVDSGDHAAVAGEQLTAAPARAVPEL